jgi:4-amino-4-deoxy-L-arabinose transferase-like glycosyltransferase
MTDTSTDRSASRLASAPVLLSLLAVWLLFTLGLRPLLLPDEGRYAEVARAMWQGDLLVPALDGLPFFHKPPLFYWLDIAAMQVVGANQFSARFGSAVGAWLMGAALFLAMRRWHGERTARIALGVLATTPFFFIGGQYANHDMLVGGLITAAVLALARAVESPAGRAGGDSFLSRGEPVRSDERSRAMPPRVDLPWLVAGWVLCALALLAKGLIGIVLPALVIGPWLLAQGRWQQMLKLLHPLAIAAFAVVGLPWFVAMQSRFSGFFDYFVMEQHFRRFAQSTFNNVHGPWFFIVVMPLATLPWSLWLPAAVRRAWAERNRMAGLYAWWVLAIVGFFSLPSSKLVGYALPALAPWCALLGMAVAAGPARRRLAVLAAAALACVALVGIAAWKAPQSNKPLGLALGAAVTPADMVVMVDEYLYDVPFYAQLTRPVVIVGNWADPEIPRRDNWRKEVFDAARFDKPQAEALLRPLAEIATLACRTGGGGGGGDVGGTGAVWFVVSPAKRAAVSGQPGAARVFADPRNELWRVPARVCP